MEVSFSSWKMQKICNSPKEMQAKYGPRMARILQQWLSMPTSMVPRNTVFAFSAASNQRATG